MGGEPRWWHTPIISAPEKPKQEDYHGLSFVSLGYRSRPCSVMQTNCVKIYIASGLLKTPW